MNLATMKDFIKKSFDNPALVIRYVVSGLVGGVFVNLAVIYALTRHLGLWHVWSSVAAFTASLVAAFLLQKYWTFRGRGEHRTRKQLVIYSTVAICGLLFNMGALYLLADVLGFWYLGSQVVILGIIAVTSFLINKNHTFRPAEGQAGP